MSRGGRVCARPGDARGGFARASSTKPRPRPVDARAAASAASSKSAAPSWGAPGERRDIAGDGSIRVSEACVSAECWASTRALDERVAHDRLSAAVESDVNFVDAGVPPDTLVSDARFARWLRRRGGRREDLVVGGHLSPGAFPTRESSSDRAAAAFGTDEAERTAVAVDPKRAYRSVDDAIDRLLLSTGAEWIDVLHVPWLCLAPDALRGRRRFERVAPRDARADAGAVGRDDRWNRVVTRTDEPFTTAMDALRFAPISASSDPGDSRAARLFSLTPFSADARVADARRSAVREAHRAALLDAVRGGKVRKLCVCFETPWDACSLELGDLAFFEARELAARRDAPGSALGDAVAGVSLSLSALRDPRLARRGDDYEATLARWCAPGALNPNKPGETAAFASGTGRGTRKPVVAARGAFFPNNPRDDFNFDFDDAGRASSSALVEEMVRAASAFGAFTREDVALGLARARGYAASVALGSVSSCASTEAMDDETFARRLAAFGLEKNGGGDGESPFLHPACLAAVDAARLKHFQGASDAERGRGRGRGRGRDPFEARDEDRE